MVKLDQIKKMAISVVIPCWNGKELLKKFLPSVLKIGADEIIVVDDASTDDSVQFLKKNFPEIVLLEHKKNLGFSVACNDGVNKAIGEIIILLNQDVLPQEDLLKFVLPHFENKSLFAVTFHEREWGWGKLVWKNGLVEHCSGEKSGKPHFSAWANGGSAAFRKSIWQKLGGLDLLYHPFYWEDIDLGYRAWRQGYKIIWEPRAVVEHHHQTTIGSAFPKDYINFISARNQLIFIWKNINDLRLLAEHAAYLVKYSIKHPGYLKIVLAGLLVLPRIVRSRCRQGFYQKLSDKEIFSFFEE